MVRFPAALILLVIGCALSPSGAGAEADSTVSVNVLGSKTYRAPAAVTALAVGYTHGIAAGLQDGKLVIWDKAGSDPQIVQAHGKRINALQYSNDGDYLATISDDGQVAVWNARLHALVTGATQQVSWKAASLDRVDHFDEPRSVKPVTLDFSSSLDDSAEKHLAVGYDNGSVRIWTLNEPQPVRTFQPHRGKVLAAAFKYRDDNTLITVGQDFKMTVWNLATGAQLNDVNLRLVGEKGDNVRDLRYRSAAVASEGKLMAIQASSSHITGPFAGGDIVDERYIKLVNAATGAQDVALADQLQSVPGNPNAALALSSDGNLLASLGQTAAQETTVQVWDLKKRLPIGLLTVPSAATVLQFGWRASGLQLTVADGKEVRTFPVTITGSEQPTDTVCVYDLDGLNAPESDAVSDVVRDAVAAAHRYRVVSRSNWKDVMNELALSRTALVDPDNRLKLGKLLNVKYAVRGRISKVEDSYNLLLQLDEVETGLELRTKQGTQSRDGLPALARKLAGELMEN